jgi:hypothetical protein
LLSPSERDHSRRQSQFARPHPCCKSPCTSGPGGINE